MFRIAICDDEPVFSAQIDAIISHWPARPAGVRTEIFHDGDSLIRAHEEMPFDIILLDVLMPLLNGIETAAEIRSKDKNVKIVFLTSTPEFALDSYSVKASNYLLKPVDPARLLECLSSLNDDLLTHLYLQTLGVKIIIFTSAPKADADDFSQRIPSNSAARAPRTWPEPTL